MIPNLLQFSQRFLGSSPILESIAENVNMADSAVAPAQFKSSIIETFAMLDKQFPRGWLKINDSDTITWAKVNDSQTTIWHNINNSQAAGWKPVDDTQ
mgnify:CR=1 FL=1